MGPSRRLGILDPGYTQTPVGKGVIAAMVLIALLWVVLETIEHCQGPQITPPHTDTNLTRAHSRERRDAINLVQIQMGQVAVTRQGKMLVFWYNSSGTQVATYTFDFCQIITCPSPSPDCSYYASGTIYICVTDSYWGWFCKHWGAAAWNTGTDWGYKPDSAINRKDKNGIPLRTRMTITKTGQACVEGKPRGNPQRLTLNIENPSPGDEGIYMIGLHPGGYIGKFFLKDMYNNAEFKAVQMNKPDKPTANIQAIANPTFEETMAIETGYSDTNLWLEWMRYTAKQHNMTNCYVCASARPHLGTVPLPLPTGGEKCFLSLYKGQPNNQSNVDPLCKMWMANYPLKQGTHEQLSHPATVYKGNYSCYRSAEVRGINVSTFPPGYCATTKPADQRLMFHQTHSLGDIYWLCGDLKLRSKLPAMWKGECTLAKLIMPIHMFKDGDEDLKSGMSRLVKRELKGSLDPHVYIDAIGVPRGVPDEFKARNQVAAGFESLIPQIAINKNVDWINYIYYNQQRFVNFTRDAIQGIVNELGPNSKMTFQNRMALDMILAEKGGVCKFLGLGGACCTYIPSETGPDGRVTEALTKLTDLSEELKRNSGVSDPFSKWFENWFGDWKGFFKSIGTTIFVMVLMLSLLACCVVPLIKKYLASFITTKTEIAMYSAVNTQGTDDKSDDEHEYPRIDFTHL